MTPSPDESTKLDAAGITRVQEIIGGLLFYGRAVNSTMMVALLTLAPQQENITKSTAKVITQLLNYAAEHPDATIRYIASDIDLHIHSDASYLSGAHARSCVGEPSYWPIAQRTLQPHHPLPPCSSRNPPQHKKNTPRGQRDTITT
jgi:hypothetical protein